MADTRAAGFGLLSHGAEPSWPISEMLSDKPMSFWIEQSGVRFYLNYFCKNDQISQVFLFAKHHSESDAEKTYLDFLKYLLNLYGKPCIDWGNLSFLERLWIWIETGFSTEYFNFTDWMVGEKVMASLKIREYPSEWVVSLRIAGPSEAVIVYPNSTELPLDTGAWNCLE